MAATNPLPTPTSTRLLTLHPAPSSNSTVIASLSTIDLAHPAGHAPYEAISYTWGPEEPPSASHTITLDNAPVPVRTNLHQCLLRLRHPTQPRVLWCDYLCITQTDLAEKAAQVQMIGEIFTAAERVLVWLGEHAEGSEALFPGRGEWRPRPLQETQGFKAAWRDLMGPTDKRAAAEQEEAEVQRAWAWVRFFHRSYWRRTWIVQELRLAREIVVHVGGDVAGWEDLIAKRFTKELGVLGPFDGIETATYLDHSSFEDPRFLLQASLSWVSKFVPLARPGGEERPGRGLRKTPGHVILDDWEEGGKDIFQVVGRFQDTFCFDRRDKVFAIHTLEERGEGVKPVAVDYEVSLPELVVRLFADRYVYTTAAPQLPGALKSGLRGVGIKSSLLERGLDQKQVPDASGLVEALGFGQPECDEVARLSLQRGRNEGEPYAWRWQRVAKAVQKALEAVVKDREFNELMLEGKAMVTHPPPSVQEKLFWLGRQRYFQQ